VSSVTTQQETTRLAELVRLAPISLGSSVITLIEQAAALAIDGAAAERIHPTSVCASSALAQLVFDDTMRSLANLLFRELIGTDLCADEPPDTRGAAALVNHWLTMRATTGLDVSALCPLPPTPASPAE
jgi:hypothetical protein